MKNYKLMIELISDAMPGSGEGYGAVIDSDIVFDETGLPYIPGRRIKGCLKDSALQIIKRLNASGNSFFSEDDLKVLFGKKGEKFSNNSGFDNLFLTGYKEIKDAFDYLIAKKGDYFNQSSIINQFTNIRKNTQIENGIAKEHSLRTIRVLNKGNKFQGEISLDFDDNKYEILLALSVMNLRRFGSKRTRGLGEIKCTLDDESLNDKAIAFLDNGGNL